MRPFPRVVLTEAEVQDAVQRALAEDLGPGDVTTRAVVPAATRARARLVARQPVVVAGLAFAVAAFRCLSSRVRIEPEVEDGARVRPGDTLLRVSGPAQALLTAERDGLELSPTALRRRHADRALRGGGGGTRAQILDTRKTTPGWRRFEKYAVACGGGRNHRLGLHDLVLLKDNHLAALAGQRPDPVTAAVRRARRACPGLPIEVEADTLTQVRQAVAAGADLILLDNMSPARLREAVALVGGRAGTEASGGVNLGTVRAIAETGVDYISVGALTHSAPAVDLALDFETARRHRAPRRT
ncbi:MAG: carboxylating nicotinate-nucleotide diphosphorylase [Verrucomicrobia bacterium]|nr:carboxylating nicotinate-nucleotide diphosphorylase [Verrucomicrobiota bacterium]